MAQTVCAARPQSPHTTKDLHAPTLHFAFRQFPPPLRAAQPAYRHCRAGHPARLRPGRCLPQQTHHAGRGLPPGGSTDLTGRVLGAELAKKLGVSVVIENVGGAGGAIGAQKVANTAPDGYTLLVGANNEIAIKRLAPPATVKYEAKDFTPWARLPLSPWCGGLAQNRRNLAEFMTLTKANPGKFSYGSSGVGTALHLAGEMVKDQGGLSTDAHSLPGRGPADQRLVGNNLRVCGVRALQRLAAHQGWQSARGLGHHRAQARGRHPRCPCPVRAPCTEKHRHRQLVRADGPGQAARTRGGQVEKALAESLDRPSCARNSEDSGSAIAPLNVDMPKFLADETAKYKKIVDFASIQE